MTMFEKKGIQNIIRRLNKKTQTGNDSMKTDKLMIVALSSAIGGALLGILFAPDKGAKTRKNVAKKRDEYLQEIKKNTEDLGKQLKKNKDSVLEKSKETAQTLKKEVEDYSEWTFQELYDRAKELKVEGYSQMNKSELVQALKGQ